MCEKADRRISSLNPEYRDRFVRYLDHLEKTFPQFQIIVTETLRSQSRQNCLRKTGASKAVRSNHQDGNAMDIALYRHSARALDWNPATYRNVYRLADPREFGLTSGEHLWAWDAVHLQPVELQGAGRDLGKKLESY